MLKNVSIIYIQQDKTIEISANERIIDIKLWYQKKILGLKTWFDIKATSFDGNKIWISLN